MATPYERAVRTTANHNPIKTSRSKHSNHKALIILALIIIAGIAWYNSDYWPWPSKDRINERLDKVIDTCNGNETSKACKDIQKRYNMTFMYCHSLADSGKTNTFYLNGQSFEIPTFPWHAVAWEGTSSKPPEYKMTIGDNVTTMPSIYYGCQEHTK